MVQTFLSGIRGVRKSRHNAVLVAVSVALALLFALFPAPADRILNIQNYLITVGGIMSAFVIAYLASKVFDVRRERSAIKAELDVLSEKLTLFRKLLFYVMKSEEFWVKYKDIAELKRRFQSLNYERLHTMGDDPVRQNFWSARDISHTTFELYLAMEAITGELDEHGQLAWIYDATTKINYSREKLAQCYEPCNQIWYLLEGRFAKHGYGLFKDTEIWIGYKSDARECIARLDDRFKGKDFHRELLASISSNFHEAHLPRMKLLISENVGVPGILQSSFRSLSVVMIFGVLLPIVLQSVGVSDKVNVSLTLFFVWVTALALLSFMQGFSRFLHEDTAVIKEQ